MNGLYFCSRRMTAAWKLFISVLAVGQQAWASEWTVETNSFRVKEPSTLQGDYDAAIGDVSPLPPPPPPTFNPASNPLRLFQRWCPKDTNLTTSHHHTHTMAHADVSLHLLDLLVCRLYHAVLLRGI